MALKATIFKAVVNVADTERHVCLEQALTLARHPSETDARMMVRLLAWCMRADPGLEFTRGLCAEDEPDLWRHELHGDISEWIEVGLPEPKRLKRACNRSQQVVLFAYGARAAHVWWQQNQTEISKLANLQLYYVDDSLLEPLAALAERTMSLQVTISDGSVWISAGEQALSWTPERWM